MRYWMNLPVWAGTLLMFIGGALAASAGPVDEWAAGLDGVLAFRFEVTFMKIDVADIEARISPAAESALKSLAAEGKRTNQRMDRGRRILLDSDSIAFGMTFLREGGYGRFLAGMRDNMEAAVDEGIITEDEFAAVWPAFETFVNRLEERGAQKGDLMFCLVRPDGARLVYKGPTGELLGKAEFAEEAWSRAIKGMFLAGESRFSRKFLEALWSS